MKKIYSKIEPAKLICNFLKFSEITNKRCDISPEEEFIQVSGRILEKDFIVPAHKHNFQKRETNLTQETWIVIKGKLKAKFFDLDDKFLDEIIMNDGDCIAIFRGGHQLEVLDENTYFYEVKNGPYNGIQKDKKNLKKL